jgi:DNA-binding CsgD family transcriptional regulator/tetratricopeptide (TPR) repeat protein
MNERDDGAPIFGRDSERAAVEAFLAGRPATASALLIEGDAGIGKTTIVRYAIARAGAEGLRVFAARPGAGEADLPHAGLGDLLATLDDAAVRRLPGPQRRAIHAARRRGGVGTLVDEHALARGVLELLRREAEGSRLLLAVDDVQWLDRPTLAALSFALRRLQQVPLQVMVARRTARDASVELRLGLEDWSDVRRSVVGPMEVTDLGRLLRERLGTNQPRPRLEALARASAGNPMLALELARLGYDTDTVGVPPTLPEAVEQRLLGQDAAARSAVVFAAAALRPTIGLLLRGGVDRDDLRSALASGLLTADGERLEFAHPLLGSAAYGLLLPDERRAVHERLASAADEPVERGHHAARSADGFDETAISALDRAAESASALGDHAGAAAFLLRRAELCRESDPGRAIECEAEAANELALAGDLDAAAAHARSAVERLPAGVARARARVTLADCLVGGEMSYVGYLDHVTDALADAEGDDAVQAALLVTLGETTGAMGRLGQACEHLRTAADLAERAGDVTTRSVALGLLGFLECLLGHGVSDAARAAAEEWEPDPFGISAYSPRMSLAEACLYTGEFSEAERLYRAELATAEEYGWETIEVIARGHLAETQTRAGDWAAALGTARLAMEHARQAANEQVVTGAAWGLGMVEALLGDLDSARARAVKALAAAEATDDFWHTMFNRAVLGFVALSSNDPAEAVEVLEPAWTALRNSELGELSVFPVANVFGEALVAVRRVDEALAVVAGLRSCPAAERAWCRVMANRVEGLAASAQGDHEGARRAVAAALDAHAELPEPFELARTVHIRGRIEHRARNWGAARVALTDALDRYDQLGAARWAEHTTADLARLPGRRPNDGEGLTAREREVADLVAAGLSNKEVAARLFLSVRTVESNLSRVYAKLGVRSRASLGRALASRRLR